MCTVLACRAYLLKGFMQQQEGHSAATFYAKLVNVSSVGEFDLQVADNAYQRTPGLLPLAEQLTAGACSSPAVQQPEQQTQQQHAGAAGVAESSLVFKPVRFAQPVILDPNTGMMTLPPKAANNASRLPAAAAAAAGGATTTISSKGNDSRRHSSFQHLVQSGINNQHSSHQHSSSSSMAHRAAPAVAGASSKRPIERSNIGFQLLQKAGWQEGKGLGAQEQGMGAPLQSMPNKGNKGLGFAPHQQQQQQQSLGLQDPAEGSTVEVKPSVAGPILGSKRVASLVEAELAAEDVDAKVKRHRQVLQQEAKDKRDKAIQQYLYRAFNETSDYGSGDSNPLGKNHRLTATNPLLD